MSAPLKIYSWRTLLVGASCLTAVCGRFITWGFEDYDFDDSVFELKFPGRAEITRIEGVVSASTLPYPMRKIHNRRLTDGYVRQILLVCHNGTRSPQDPVVLAHTPNDAVPKRWENSISMSPVEINLKQMRAEIIHLPIREEFESGALIVQNNFICRSTLITYTGLGTNATMKSFEGKSTDPHECLDVEVHFQIHYNLLPLNPPQQQQQQHQQQNIRRTMTTRPHYYLLLVTQRSGGTWLSETLDTHPDLHVKGEIVTFVAAGLRKQTASMFFEQCPPDVVACAFRVPYNAFLEGGMDVWLKGRSDVSVVLVTRQHKLSQYVSAELSKQLVKDNGNEAAFHCRSGASCVASHATITLDKGEVLGSLRTLAAADEQMRVFLRGTSLRWREFYYEDFTISGMGTILAFMHVAPRDLSGGSSLQKRMNNPLSDTITNFADVVDAVKHSEMRWLLGDFCYDRMGTDASCSA